MSPVQGAENKKDRFIDFNRYLHSIECVPDTVLNSISYLLLHHRILQDSGLKPQPFLLLRILFSQQVGLGSVGWFLLLVSSEITYSTKVIW